MKRKDFIKIINTSVIIATTGLDALATTSDRNTHTTDGEPIICSTCGTQYKDTSPRPDGCPICNNDRQYVPPQGQTWTSLPILKKNYTNSFTKIHDNLFEIKTSPKLMIGQRAFLIITPGGNILWDCITLIDQPTIDFIRSKGGLKAIIFSHPHYFTTMNVWAAEFDCPVLIHQNDEEWVMNKGPHISFWTGAEKQLWDGISIINIGGHFPGSSVLRVPFYSAGGTIFSGDTFMIAPNKKHISIMYSYPNFIPLPLAEIQRIRKLVEPISFDSMIGAFDNQQVSKTAKELLQRSLEKYV